MDRDLTVFTILMLLLLLDGVGVWHISPELSGPACGSARILALALTAAFAVSGAVFSGLSLILAKRMISRVF